MCLPWLQYSASFCRKTYIIWKAGGACQAHCLIKTIALIVLLKGETTDFVSKMCCMLIVESLALRINGGEAMIVVVPKLKNGFFKRKQTSFKAECIHFLKEVFIDCCIHFRSDVSSRSGQLHVLKCNQIYTFSK